MALRPFVFSSSVSKKVFTTSFIHNMRKQCSPSSSMVWRGPLVQSSFNRACISSLKSLKFSKSSNSPSATYTRPIVPPRDLLGYVKYPEITPQKSARLAIFSVLDDKELINSDKVLCICAGDGPLPITGTHMILNTKWNVISIDPDGFKSQGLFENRMKCYKSKVEDVDLFHSNPASLWELVVIMRVYADAATASLQLLYDRLPSKQAFIIVAAHNPEPAQEIRPLEPILEYSSLELHGEFRRIQIWKGCKP